MSEHDQKIVDWDMRHQGNQEDCNMLKTHEEHECLLHRSRKGNFFNCKIATISLPI